MDVARIRRLLASGKIDLRFTDHAITEARKDGLTTQDLERAVVDGEIVEDYGERVLLLNITKPDRLPCHVVIEYGRGDTDVTVVTAYVPAAAQWEPDWKTRRRKRSR